MDPGPVVTVTVRVAGVGSANPKESVTVNVTVKVPALLNVTDPGSCVVELEIPEPVPKFHRYVSGVLLSGSLPVPVKFTDCPTVMLTLLAGVSITPFGA